MEVGEKASQMPWVTRFSLPLPCWKTPDLLISSSPPWWGRKVKLHKSKPVTVNIVLLRPLSMTGLAVGMDTTLGRETEK